MWVLQVLLWTTFGIKRGLAADFIPLGCLDSRCFWLATQHRQWGGFGPVCQMLNGSHLAAIPDMETNRFLTLAVLPHNVDPIYIGALTETFTWQWVTGETYQGNVIRSPVTPDCERRVCGALVLGESSSESLIEAMDCITPKRYICKKKGVPSTNENMFISTHDETWYDARYACSSRGMEILAFADVTMDVMFSMLMQRREVTESTLRDVWVGIYSERLIWTSTGEEMVYNNLRHGCQGETLRLLYDGTWEKVGACCGPAICENVQDGRIPGPSAGKGNSLPQDSQSSLNILYNVVVPAVCGAGGCIIVIVIVAVAWRLTWARKKTSTRTHKKTRTRTHEKTRTKNIDKQNFRNRPNSNRRFDNRAYHSNTEVDMGYMDVIDDGPYQEVG